MSDPVLVLAPTALPENKSAYNEDDFVAVNPNKKEEEFRNYENSARQTRVSEFYYFNHTHQTVDYVQNLKQKIKFDNLKMTVWEAFQFLDNVIDDSDPDTNLTQITHGLQTAEAIRKQYPELDWLHLVGLIHDLGKVLCSPGYNLPQWAIVGDTTPLGCKFSKKNVFYEFYKNNPDFYHPVYSTKLGIYQKNCGLMNILMSYGHDEYLYQVLLHNNSELPLQALYIIRFHSFYAWHKYGGYQYLANDIDNDMLYWIKLFNNFDLYSKSTEVPKLDDVEDYYKSLIDKYLPGTLSW